MPLSLQQPAIWAGNADGSAEPAKRRSLTQRPSKVMV